MFNPFKKPKPEPNPSLEALWTDFLIDDTPFAQWVVSASLTVDVLEVSVRLPDTKVPQVVYDALCAHLANTQGHTIKEVNLTVLTKEAAKPPSSPNAAHALATNAMPQEAPILKSAPTQSALAPHPRIRHIIVVASGKGGVGKSTTAVNVALALQKLGKRVGILDADIYGPSIPDMLGVAGVKPALEHEQFIPIEVNQLAMLSIGSLLEGETTPVAWRGIKATGALMQLYGQTNWPQLDYLVIDMPPGTGDIQLTLAQRIPVTAAVIVTTPQHIALLDVKKGMELFAKTHIPVLGIIENMALHTCSQCGHSEAIFGTGGGDEMAKLYNVPLLGQLPLARQIREQMDKGVPSVLADDEFATFYMTIAKNIEKNIAPFAKQDSGRIF